MRRRIKIVLLSLGVVLGYGLAIAQFVHHRRHDHYAMRAWSHDCGGACAHDERGPRGGWHDGRGPRGGWHDERGGRGYGHDRWHDDHDRWHDEHARHEREPSGHHAPAAPAAVAPQAAPAAPAAPSPQPVPAPAVTGSDADVTMR
jgi:hypothetical protein